MNKRNKGEETQKFTGGSVYNYPRSTTKAAMRKKGDSRFEEEKRRPRRKQAKGGAGTPGWRIQKKGKLKKKGTPRQPEKTRFRVRRQGKAGKRQKAQDGLRGKEKKQN